MTQAVWEDDALIVGEGGRRQTIVGGENHGPFGRIGIHSSEPEIALRLGYGEAESASMRRRFRSISMIRRSAST